MDSTCNVVMIFKVDDGLEDFLAKEELPFTLAVFEGNKQLKENVIFDFLDDGTLLSGKIGVGRLIDLGEITLNTRHKIKPLSKIYTEMMERYNSAKYFPYPLATDADISNQCMELADRVMCFLNEYYMALSMYRDRVINRPDSLSEDDLQRVLKTLDCLGNKYIFAIVR